MGEIVFTLTIEDRHGTDTTVYRTEDGATQALARYCRDHWVDWCYLEEVEAPADDKSLIDAYFNVARASGEGYSIDQATIQGTTSTYNALTALDWARTAIAAHAAASGFRDEDETGDDMGLQIWQLLVSLRNLCEAEKIDWHGILAEIDRDWRYLALSRHSDGPR